MPESRPKTSLGLLVYGLGQRELRTLGPLMFMPRGLLGLHTDTFKCHPPPDTRAISSFAPVFCTGWLAVTLSERLLSASLEVKLPYGVFGILSLRTPFTRPSSISVSLKVRYGLCFFTGTRRPKNVSLLPLPKTFGFSGRRKSERLQSASCTCKTGTATGMKRSPLVDG